MTQEERAEKKKGGRYRNEIVEEINREQERETDVTFTNCRE